ncbi:xanthine dehydrogenase accessory protein XdhC [Castellaniella daejeonensis]|jgi:xanthine dehydrogenase accessory factor|uniref:Xanthine dehydrogenase accessory protein XdhC n=1 Tax=Castellaniella daejeonensis TaxID=659013 RepID=A0ABN0TUN1_9BURK|nr:xanthine dehydrogenase accessory protein XdhC [Castellaniella sp.]HET8703480.1 xanthine dehydrogenase accessory protein XdhC [Castellaniella sp.]
MHAWIDQALWCLDRRQAAVLVTVAWVQGSAPREAGAKMLVSAGHQWLTIGGGHLEWKAAESARARLRADDGPDRWIEALPLGPALGQCCGGMVHLLFERLRESDRGWLEAVRAGLQSPAGRVREVRLGGDGAAPCVRVSEPDAAAPGGIDADAGRLLRPGPGQGCLTLRETIRPDPLHVVIFGAGHVGQALVHILGTLPCRVTWVDARDELFPGTVPANVSIEATDTPEAVIDEAPPDSCFLIMTHDHALDQRLCEQLLRRDDVAYFGLIGSQTKRRKFEHRFQARGIPPERYARIVCPIGEPGIEGKQPAVIAVAVAAQLLRLRSERERLAGAQARTEAPAH